MLQAAGGATAEPLRCTGPYVPLCPLARNGAVRTLPAPSSVRDPWLEERGRARGAAIPSEEVARAGLGVDRDRRGSRRGGRARRVDDARPAAYEGASGSVRPGIR